MLIACNNKNGMAVLSVNKNFTVVPLSTDKLPIIQLDGVSTCMTCLSEGKTNELTRISTNAYTNYFIILAKLASTSRFTKISACQFKILSSCLFLIWFLNM